LQKKMPPPPPPKKEETIAPVEEFPNTQET